MAETKTLHDLFVHELRDIYDGERQLTASLPKMIQAISSEELRDAFERYLSDTEQQIQRLEQAFAMMGLRQRGIHCEGIAGILEEGRNLIDDDLQGPVLDAALIGEAQRVDHYKMAAFGTMETWARTMGQDEVADLLHESLEEEKEIDARFSSIALRSINDAAAHAAESETPSLPS